MGYYHILLSPFWARAVGYGFSTMTMMSLTLGVVWRTLYGPAEVVPLANMFWDGLVIGFLSSVSEIIEGLDSNKDM